MIFYHGTNQDIGYLSIGSHITKSFKDACKFGYRKAVVSNSSFVYVYKVNISEEPVKKDKNRDRAFIITVPINVELESQYPTYQTPHKLKKFKIRA